MKKNIVYTLIFAAVLAGHTYMATAQDVTVLHMKDGTSRRYTNGDLTKTIIKFWSFVPDTIAISSTTTYHNNDYEVEWNVDEVWHTNGQYSVGICWIDDFPNQSYARHGILFGTSPNLTVDNCDSVKYESEVWGAAVFTKDGIRIENANQYSGNIHYMIIGQNSMNILRFGNGSYGVEVEAYGMVCNRLNCTLETDKTYYYRTFVDAMVEQGGEQRQAFFYGPEKSFRIPRVMADFNYYNPFRPTDDACSAFYQAHFPDSVTAPTWTNLEPLWNEWRATEEGGKVDLEADITSEQFDDGTGYRLNRMPGKFYTWLTKQKMVIDAFDGLKEVSTYRDENYYYQPTVSPDQITVDDAAWGIHGGRYVRFTPLRTTTNNSATYSCAKVVPGVRYRLLIIFAPETVYDDEEAKLPTLVRVTANGSIQADRQEVSATEVTTLDLPDFSTKVMGLDLKIETCVTSAQIRNKKYNRILRIAQIRLTPIEEE